MRKKHQQTFGRRGNVREIPNSRPKAQKLHCSKVSEKAYYSVESREAIGQSIIAVQSSLKVKIIENCKGILTILLLICIYATTLWLMNKGPEDKKEDVILRHYSEILNKLDDEPEDISASPYQSNVPKAIQKDIDKMLSMGEDASIVYYNDARDQVVIEPCENAENGYKVYFREAISPYSSMSVEELKQYISFYKRDDTLVIYGQEYGRKIERYIMNNEKMKTDWLDNGLVDLYGTDIKDEDIDEVRYLDSVCTLVQKDSEFSLYRLSEKIYTENFNGGEVKQWSYEYLQSVDGDCYNVYYCTDLNNPWIKFSKVAENVDEILEDERIYMPDEDGYNRHFSMLRIGNKKYAQLPDLETENAYGQNYGRNRTNENVEADFTARLVEVSALSSSRVEIVCQEADYRGNSYAWYLNYYFQSGDREGYISKRIKGLDSEVSKVIPPEKIGMFADKVISVDEVEEYINQLRMLYDEYTDNTF